MVFIIVGMGGGIGIGVVLVVVEIVKFMDILIVGVVIKLFFFEGKRRMRYVEMGIENLMEKVDILVIIFNERLFIMVDKKIILLDLFKLVDEVLR